MGDHEPQDHGEMGGDEQLGRGALPVRVEIDHEGGGHKRGGAQEGLPQGEFSSAREVAGEEGHHEQAGVAHQPPWLLAREPRGQACDLDRDGRGDGERQRLGPAGLTP